MPKGRRAERILGARQEEKPCEEEPGGVTACSRSQVQRQGMHHFLQRNEPMVIRADRQGPGPSRDPSKDWSPRTLQQRMGNPEVTAMVYDQSLDQAQPLFTATLPFDEFLEVVSDPQQVQDQLPSPTASLYLLLSSRALREGVQGHSFLS